MKRNKQKSPAAYKRFVIDPETLVLRDTETGDRFAVSQMLRLDLPATLSPGMAPTLLPFDTVVITVANLNNMAENTLLYIRSQELPEGYAVGRYMAHTDTELILSDEKQSELMQINRGNVAGMWSINYLVNRQLR